jgi:metallo-beta-lactamase family protein
MQVQFWGAARTVTGSMHLVEVGSKKILLDCGLYQGRRKDAFHRNRDFPFDGKEIDAVILSHAHIDHSGNLPTLVRSGFRGPIFATSATRDLAVYLLLDSAKIQTSDLKYVNKRRKRQKKKLFDPLFEQKDAVKAISQFQTIDYDRQFNVVQGIECQFRVAGHMLGAASMELDLTEGNTKRRLVFSGDIGRPGVPILRDPEPSKDADYVIMEATYGDRLHPTGSDDRKMLLEIAKRTYESGGRLLMPAFSVGRTQQIVYHLNNLKEEGLLPDIRVFVDSPLAVNATDVFREHVECFDEDMVQRILEEEDSDPLAFGDLFYIRSGSQSKKLNELDEPCVIISASGMCEGGRIVHHLKHSISKPNNTIMFCGYQAPHTLGRKILSGEKYVKIFNRDYEVKAEIVRLEGSSGHADQAGLLDWAGEVHQHGDVKNCALVHCDSDAAQALKEKMEASGMKNVLIPDREDFMNLG